MSESEHSHTPKRAAHDEPVEPLEPVFIPGAGCSVDEIHGRLRGRVIPDTARLADHTTFRLGGPAHRVVHATTERELIEAVQAADAESLPLFVLSGGSNVVVADEGFPGVVVIVDTHGIDAEVSGCGGAFVRVQAGEVWDQFVEFSIDNDWIGIEALSGIPGLVGAVPIQNVGAYGQEVAQTIARVRTWDRHENTMRTFVNEQCEFAYRDSIFKRSRESGQATGRYVVLEVAFHFHLASLSTPIRYAQLAEHLGVSVGERVDARAVREAVLALRASKGMVVDTADPDTFSAGSFFTNPIITPSQAADLPEDAPKYAVPGGLIKTSAAWLIDHAGCEKGYPGAGVARLSSKHVLALTNQGGANAADIRALAHDVKHKVREAYGIDLTPEPITIGIEI